MQHTIADLLDLRSQVKQALQDSKGPSCRKMFEAIVPVLDGYIDLIHDNSTTPKSQEVAVSKVFEESQSDDLAIGELIDQTLIQLLLDHYAQIAEFTSNAVPICLEVGDELTADLFMQITGYLDLKRQFLKRQLGHC